MIPIRAQASPESVGDSSQLDYDYANWLHVTNGIMFLFGNRLVYLRIINEYQA